MIIYKCIYIYIQTQKEPQPYTNTHTQTHMDAASHESLTGYPSTLSSQSAFTAINA